ncbi:hypothetical protein V2A60_010155 [Cordyceps javanica]
MSGSNFIANSTEAHPNEILKRTDDDCLASVASCADSIRYPKWGKFTEWMRRVLAHELDRAGATTTVPCPRGAARRPLHKDDVFRGGNGIHLHHVWDSSILEKWLGGLRGKPYPLAKRAGRRNSWVKDTSVESS